MNRRYPVAGSLHMIRGAWRLVLVLLTAVLLPGCSSQAAPIVIQWSTETEVNTAGFNVFRSDSRDGQYVQINANLVPSSPDPLLGGRYAYTDAQVEAGKTYFYKLEELESTGNRITYDRIVEATAYAQGFLGLSYTVWAAFIAALVILMGVSAFVRRRQHSST